MNQIKRILGLVWMLLGVLAVYYLIYNQAIPLWKAGGANLIPAVIYIFVLCPIVAGSLGCFGWFCWKGDFDR
jgi:hypothetical protein